MLTLKFIQINIKLLYYFNNLSRAKPDLIYPVRFPYPEPQWVKWLYELYLEVNEQLYAIAPGWVTATVRVLLLVVVLTHPGG